MERQSKDVAFREKPMGQVITVKRRPYSVVPDDVLTDLRLGCTARVVLSWMLGRGENFELRVWHVRKTFGLSEQRWLKARREMQSAGYFRQERIQDTNGRLRWIQIVTDAPEAEPYPQKPGYGEPGHGGPCPGIKGYKPVLSKTSKSNTNKKNKQLPPQKSAAESGDTQPIDVGAYQNDLVWPHQLTAIQRQAIASKLSGIISADAQFLLDELAGVLTTNSIKTSPERWMRAVIARYEQGEFEPVSGVAIAHARAIVKAPCQMSASEEIKPSSPEVGQHYLNKIGEILRVGGLSKHGEEEAEGLLGVRRDG